MFVIEDDACIVGPVTGPTRACAYYYSQIKDLAPCSLSKIIVRPKGG